MSNKNDEVMNIDKNQFKLDSPFILELKKDLDEYKERTGRTKKHLTVTYGCQMNEHDSETMDAILQEIGYEPTEDKEEADIIIINTCLIRENAELRVYGKLGEYKALKKKKPDMIIAVCGCMMQKEEPRTMIKNKFRFVDLIFGTHNIHKLPELLYNMKQSENMMIDVWEESGEIMEGIPARRKYDYKAFVNIMYGCNNFCTYCVVPYTRGREKSREVADIVEEIKQLVSEGTKEITLLGQNVNSYGKTLEEKTSFADLLREVDKIEGLDRVRFMTSHPKDLSDELIEAMKECDSVCEQIHLPFQAGSNEILKKMNRRYTKEKYLELISKIKEAIPNITVSTDIIVGFPGETYEDFQETLDVVKQVEFDSAFTFLYSVREGTPAAEMEEQVPEDEKNKRFQELLSVLHPINNKRNMMTVGNIESVLVEDVSKNDSDKLAGRTRGGKLVHFKGDNSLIGNIVNVRIDEAKTWSLEGTVVE